MGDIRTEHEIAEGRNREIANRINRRGTFLTGSREDMTKFLGLARFNGYSDDDAFKLLSNFFDQHASPNHFRQTVEALNVLKNNVLAGYPDLQKKVDEIVKELSKENGDYKKAGDRLVDVLKEAKSYRDVGLVIDAMAKESTMDPKLYARAVIKLAETDSFSAKISAGLAVAGVKSPDITSAINALKNGDPAPLMTLINANRDVKSSLPKSMQDATDPAAFIDAIAGLDSRELNDLGDKVRGAVTARAAAEAAQKAAEEAAAKQAAEAKAAKEASSAPPAAANPPVTQSAETQAPTTPPAPTTPSVDPAKQQQVFALCNNRIDADALNKLGIPANKYETVIKDLTDIKKGSKDAANVDDETRKVLYYLCKKGVDEKYAATNQAISEQELANATAAFKVKLGMSSAATSRLAKVLGPKTLARLCGENATSSRQPQIPTDARQNQPQEEVKRYDKEVLAKVENRNITVDQLNGDPGYQWALDLYANTYPGASVRASNPSLLRTEIAKFLTQKVIPANDQLENNLTFWSEKLKELDGRDQEKQGKAITSAKNAFESLNPKPTMNGTVCQTFDALPGSDDLAKAKNLIQEFIAYDKKRLGI